MLKAFCFAGVAGLILPFCMVTPAQAGKVPWAEQLGRDFKAAHQITRGKGVTVAILDDGVDGTVASLRGVVTKSKDFVGTPRPKKVHGTLMASWIAGSGPSHDAPFGMRGLAPGVKVLSVRISPHRDDPGGKRWMAANYEADALAKGIRYAADEGAQIIAVAQSYWRDVTGQIEEAVAYAHAKNTVVVAGNKLNAYYRSADGAYPASVAGAIGVGALDLNGEHYAQYSAKNSSVLVSAPGFKLPSVGPGNALWTFWGASTASTWVAAAAALVKAEYPKLSPLQVSQAIATSARHPKGKGSYDTKVGFGVVNPSGALKEARKLDESAPPAPTAKTGVVSDKQHFGGGAPGKVQAAEHPIAALAGFSALIVAGLLALGGAVLLILRSRRTAVAGAAGEASESGDAARS